MHWLTSQRWITIITIMIMIIIVFIIIISINIIIITNTIIIIRGETKKEIFTSPGLRGINLLFGSENGSKVALNS